MTTSLSFIVGLLTTVISLLTFTQQHPELPQAQRDYMRQIAETAIIQATNTLIDQNQKIFATNNTSIATNETSTSVGDKEFKIQLNKITKTSTTAQISWTLSAPASSRVTINKASAKLDPKTAQYLPSANGVSTQGLVSVIGLDPSTKYYYSIESTFDNKTIKEDGTFITEKSAQQILQEEEEARWKALPPCPINGPVYDGVCRIGNCRYEKGHPSCGG